MYQDSGFLTESLNNPIDCKFLMTSGRAFHNAFICYCHPLLPQYFGSPQYISEVYTSEHAGWLL